MSFPEALLWPVYVYVLGVCGCCGCLRGFPNLYDTQLFTAAPLPYLYQKDSLAHKSLHREQGLNLCGGLKECVAGLMFDAI